MKRWLLKIAVLLVLGAIVNVAVAWLCAVRSSDDSSIPMWGIAAPRSWPDYLQRENWPPPHTAMRQYVAGYGVTALRITGGDPTAVNPLPPGASQQQLLQYQDSFDKLFVVLEYRQFGLPMRAMQCHVHGARGRERSNVVTSATDSAGLLCGIDVDGFAGGSRKGLFHHVPLVPVWPGFVVNSIVYALVLWVTVASLIALIMMIRTRLRLKHGLCPSCAYPIGTSDLCTECGARVKGVAT